jgi:hypothetical protein
LSAAELYNRIKPTPRDGNGRIVPKDDVGANWDYKNVFNPTDSTQYQDFGNFHFGAVAAAYGIPLYIAANGAGLVQYLQGTPGQGKPLIQPPYWDDGPDYNMLVLGYRYFQWFSCMTSPSPAPMPTSAPPPVIR